MKIIINNFSLSFLSTYLIVKTVAVVQDSAPCDFALCMLFVNCFSQIK